MKINTDPKTNKVLVKAMSFAHAHVTTYTLENSMVGGSKKLHVVWISDLEQFKLQQDMTKFTVPSRQHMITQHEQVYVGLDKGNYMHESMFRISHQTLTTPSRMAELIEPYGSTKRFIQDHLIGSLVTVAFHKKELKWKLLSNIYSQACVGEIRRMRLVTGKQITDWLKRLNEQEKEKKDTIANIITTLKTRN